MAAAFVAAAAAAAAPAPGEEPQMPKPQEAKSLRLDGTGAGYLYRDPILPVTTSYPFWVSAWVKVGPRPVYSAAYNIFSSERTADFAANGTGHMLDIGVRVPRAVTANANTFTKARGEEVVLTEPYWDHLLAEFRSASDRRIYLNGLPAGSDSKDLGAPDFSAGKPQSRIGFRGCGGQPFYGSIADVVVGSGILADADRAKLATMGCNCAAIPGAAHWYRLAGNGKDSIGSAPMAESGKVAWSPDGPAPVKKPSREDYIRQVFNQPALPDTMPKVTPGKSPLASNSANLKSVEHLDVSFEDGCGPWNTRLYHLIPEKNAKDHVVFWDDGHTTFDGYEGYGGNMVVKTLLDNGYAVVLSAPPSYNPVDPWFRKHGANWPTHERCWEIWKPGANPIARWLHPVVAAMNYVAPRYSKRSVAGLSGGGWQAPRFAAVDTRINHAVIPIRGTLASRRYLCELDFEQNVAPNGWATEELYRLAAEKRRLWFVVHELENCCTGKTDRGAAGGGAYLDAKDYDRKFHDPIREAVKTDLKFIEDQESPAHATTPWAVKNVILPALSTPLPTW
jgi:hypothetical protein